MNRHTQELYRIAELPAFIEEALSNVSLKGIISAYLGKSEWSLDANLHQAIMEYAEQWVDDWMARNQRSLWDEGADIVDHEIRAIEAGVKLFSNPDCKAGLPE